MNKKQSGFTLLELMVALALSSLIFTSTFFIIIYSQRGMQHSMAEMDLSRNARQSYQQIARAVYQASLIKIKDSGNTVEATAPINTAMDKEIRTISYANNTLSLKVYDVETDTITEQRVIAKNISPLPSPNNTIFVSQNGGEVLQVNFRVFDTNNLENLNKSFPVTSLIKLRNL
ncbi:MAG: prepilin-type N-terminal cleavage/methylation domain-containing protein [Candidatus Aureabacteria bacterium]|nr:prepilin-type N-terminal cleavage/methylation domain-containing protein [Candidatus Auribacterota bacterium]